MTELQILPNGRTVDEFCQPCGLWKLCKSPRMEGEGPEHPTYLFVGEGPGGDEDEEGQPFIGKAGELLREIIQAVGIDIKACRFSNAVRCRPPQNDLKAYPNAVKHCRPHILREIHAANPKVVVLLGNTAIESVLRRKGVTKLNGEIFRAHGRYYVVCVHPAYILRDPEKEGMLQYALKIARRLGVREPKAEKFHYDYVRDKKMLQEFTDLLKTQKEAATDIEGASLSPFDKAVKPRLGCIGWCWEPTYAVCYPVYARRGMEKKIEVPPEEVLEAVGEIWSSSVNHILHFGKYDTGYNWVLYKIRLANYWFDTGLASYALNEEKGNHGLKDWAWRVGMGDHEIELREYQRANSESNPRRGGDMTLVPGQILYPYNMGDCDATLRLKNLLFPRLEKQDLYERPFQFPIMYHNWTAMQLEINGLNLDLEYNEELLGKFPDKMRDLENQIRQYKAYQKLRELRLQQLVESKLRRVKAYKRPVPNPRKKVKELVQAELDKLDEKREDVVNLSSPQDKSDLLYKFAGYKSRYTTKGGAPSVRMSFLEEMLRARPTPILQLIVDRSKYGSSYSKYVSPIQSWAGTDGRTHTSYLVHGTVTGRITSQDPNHENLPKRASTPLAKELVILLRTQFVATNDEYVMCEADEKQIEMRLFCDRAKDDRMAQEFAEGKDPHRMGAAAGYDIPEEKVTKAQRDRSKSVISFGLLYGRSAEALASDMGWDLEEAQEFIDKYFSKYDDCFAYRKTVEKIVKKQGYVLSHFYRRRRLGSREHGTGIFSDYPGTYNEALRQAINSPIQGDASDITWCAGHRLQRLLHKYKMKSRVVIINQDALFTDIFRKELDDVMALKFKLMTDREWLEKKTGWFCSVPLDVDMSLGPDLGHMVGLERRGKGFDFNISSEFR